MSANTPVFSQTPHIGQVTLTTANTATNGTGAVEELMTGEDYGTRISYIRVKAQGVTTVGKINFFIVTAGSGTSYLWSLAVTAITPSASVDSWEGYINLEDTSDGETGFPFILPSATVLKCSTYNSETFSVTCFGSHYVNPQNPA